MSITATQVKELRERTGAAMMDCKKALVETNGDIDAAIEIMRKSGQAKAVKKAGRVAAEGIIKTVLSEDNKQAIIVEVNSETDFVARGDDFLAFADDVAETGLKNQCSNVEALLAADMHNQSGVSVDQVRLNLVAKIGENINVRRIQYVTSNALIGAYIHGGRIGVLVELEGGDDELAKDVAMHIAASSPMVISQDQVSEEAVVKEKEIFSAQAKESGKPDDIIEKMVAGRIKKFVDEVSLLGQPFVKDPSSNVDKVLKEKNAKVLSFVRFAVGEGIEKPVGNFAEEVMAQVRES